MLNLHSPKYFTYQGKKIKATYLACGSYSCIYKAKGYVYTLTEECCKSKELLSLVRHLNLPPVEVLGRRKYDQAFYTIYRMPLYQEADKSHLQFLEKTPEGRKIVDECWKLLYPLARQKKYRVWKDLAVHNVAIDTNGTLILFDAFNVQEE